MQGQRLVIACRHADPAAIVRTEDGESVCKCGVVLEERMPEIDTYEPQGYVSLYHQVETGGAPVSIKTSGPKLHIYQSSVSEFSNICSKLGLTKAVEREAWRIYHVMRTKTYRTRAKCAIFAIYTACRRAGQAVPEEQIRDAVRFAMCVKHAPNTLNVISELHDDAAKIGIDSNEGHSSQYYIHEQILKKEHLFADDRDRDRFRARVMAVFATLSGNYRSRASRAVTIAMSEMGVI